MGYHWNNPKFRPVKVMDMRAVVFFSANDLFIRQA
jgi:hypothetical protein